MINLNKLYRNQPWMNWLIICLCRQRERQYWLKEIHQELLKEEDRERDGIVAGYPDWKYSYHGIGLLLIGPNNEMLDVNFHDDELATIDPYFFTTRIFGLTNPEFPERQLKRWFPSVELVILGLRLLQGNELLPKDAHTFRLNEKKEAQWSALTGLDFSLEETCQNQLGMLEDSGVNHQDNFENWLLAQLKTPDLRASSFEAIASILPPEEKIKACEEKLKEVNHTMTAAIKALETLPSPPTQSAIHLLDKLKPKKHHPYLAYTLCDFLLTRNLESDRCITMLIKFSKIRVVKGYGGNPYDYNLAYLVLRFSPKDGIHLLRNALRSSTPGSVGDAAVLMSAIDEDWCYKEIMMVLNEGAIHEVTNKRKLVRALLHSRNRDFRAVGLEHMPKSRMRTEDEVGYDYDEIIEANLDASFQFGLKSAKESLKLLDLNAIKIVAEAN